MRPHRSSTSAPHALSEVTGGTLRVRYLTPLLTAAIAVSGMAVITTASPAAAASSCYASSCNHKNPYKTTCWKDNSVVAVTVKNTNGDVQPVEPGLGELRPAHLDRNDQRQGVQGLRPHLHTTGCQQLQLRVQQVVLAGPTSIAPRPRSTTGPRAPGI
jgi:hypothetical protein